METPARIAQKIEFLSLLPSLFIFPTAVANAASTNEAFGPLLYSMMVVKQLVSVSTRTSSSWLDARHRRGVLNVRAVE